MAKNQTVRLKPGQLTEDTNAFSALSDISGYTPANATGTTKQTANSL